jgi:hypothetical protein
MIVATEEINVKKEFLEYLTTKNSESLTWSETSQVDSWVEAYNKYYDAEFNGFDVIIPNSFDGVCDITHLPCKVISVVATWRNK